MFGTVSGDVLDYSAQFTDYNVGNNKLIYLTLSNLLGSISTANNANKFSLGLNVTGQLSQVGALSNASYYAYSVGTIECWIYNTQFYTSSNGHQSIIVKQFAYSLHLKNNILGCYNWNSGYVSTGVTINTNQWYHIANVFQAGVTNGSKIYVNGLPVLTFTYTINHQRTPLAIGSGSGASGGVESYYGYIDEMRIWSIALNDATILQNYNKKLDVTTVGLTGYWAFDESSGSIANNLIVGGPNFNLYNSPTRSSTIIPPIILSNNNNYQLASSVISGNILPKPLTTQFTGINKAYDATTTASFTYKLLGTISGDIIDISNNYISNFINSNIGNSKQIIVDNLTTTNPNYTIISSNTSANITQKIVTVNFISLDKYYDGTNIAPLAYTISGIYFDISNVTLNYTATFRDFNANNNIIIDISNIYVSSNNYYVNPYSLTIGNIYKKYITPIGNDKIYDKTTNATATLSGSINNDFISYFAYFENYDAGSNKLMNVVLSGSILNDPIFNQIGLVNYYPFDFGLPIIPLITCNDDCIPNNTSLNCVKGPTISPLLFLPLAHP